MQNIITENENDAKRLIEYLREKNLGRATFLPMSTINGKKIDKIKGKKEGFIGIASDLIKYDKKYIGIIEYLLGRTVIAKNTENAIKIAKENGYAFRIVTLDGDIINPAGSMSGGSVNKKTVNILGRSKQIENLLQETTNIKKQIEILKNKKNNILKDFNLLIEKENILKNTFQTIEIKYNVEKQKVDNINELIEKTTINLNKFKKEKQELEITRQDFIKQIEEKNKQKEEIESQSLNLKKIIDEFSFTNKDIQKEVDDLNFDITNLKISVSSFNESENSINEMTEMLKSQIDIQKNNIDVKQKQIKQMEEEKINLLKNIEDYKKQIEELKENVSKSSKNIEKMKEERIKINENLKTIEQDEVDEFKIIEDLKEQIIKQDVKKNKLEDDLNNLITLLWDEYELTPNNIEGFEKPTNISKATKIVNNLRGDLKALGSINVDSIEEYKTLKQRYDFMCEQRVDLENTMSKLRNVISEITEKMKVQFKEKMQIINKNFGETFKELFGGGEAKIVLQDEGNILECGIDIIAQPPGKKLQSMALLSGGERAFTAIALLFSILKMNPAPFCVLDEIEAALDDVNVNRYALFLKKFAMQTQFLVITHRKGTMEVADTVYGVTMEEKGISKLLSMQLKQNN